MMAMRLLCPSHANLELPETCESPNGPSTWKTSPVSRRETNIVAMRVDNGVMARHFGGFIGIWPHLFEIIFVRLVGSNRVRLLQ